MLALTLVSLLERLFWFETVTARGDTLDWPTPEFIREVINFYYLFFAAFHPSINPCCWKEKKGSQLSPGFGKRPSLHEFSWLQLRRELLDAYLEGVQGPPPSGGPTRFFHPSPDPFRGRLPFFFKRHSSQTGQPSSGSTHSFVLHSVVVADIKRIQIRLGRTTETRRVSMGRHLADRVSGRFTSDVRPHSSQRGKKNDPTSEDSLPGAGRKKNDLTNYCIKKSLNVMKVARSAKILR